MLAYRFVMHLHVRAHACACLFPSLCLKACLSVCLAARPPVRPPARLSLSLFLAVPPRLLTPSPLRARLVCLLVLDRQGLRRARNPEVLDGSTICSPYRSQPTNRKMKWRVTEEFNAVKMGFK